MAITVKDLLDNLSILATAAGPFIPPPFNIATLLLPTGIKVIGNLIDLSQNADQIDWQNVDWVSFRRNMSVVEMIERKYGGILTGEEIDEIMGL